MSDPHNLSALDDPRGERRERQQLAWLHALFVAFVVVYGLLVVGLHSRYPLTLWDETRNANNAIEMVTGGHWLVAYFDGAPDHWNTKPLLLIWIIAGLTKLGFPAMTALRLPSAFAAMGTVWLVYRFCATRLQRPLAGMAAALLMMSSTIYFSLHLAFTGDYDALLCLLITLYCLGFWTFVESDGADAMPGLALAGIALTLAVLTKGIAGVMPLPGLFLFVILRGRFARVMRDYRLWLVLLGVVGVIALYYKTRDMADPGYLHAVWLNELSGRYAAANEGHAQPTLYYFTNLLRRFEPGTLLLPFGLLFLLRRSLWSSRAYSVALMCVCVSVELLVVLTKAKTKIDYYCAPTIPLLAILVGLGLSSFPGWLRERTGRQWIAGTRWAALVVLMLMGSASFAMIHNEGSARLRADLPQSQYGEAIGEMTRQGIKGPIVLVDDGVTNSVHFAHYNPFALFFAKDALRRNVDVRIQIPGQALESGVWVVSCDPTSIAWIRREYPLQSGHDVGPCTFGQTSR